MTVTQAHLHLLLNHLPIIGLPFVALLLAAGILRRSRELQIAALTGVVLVALATVPVYLTGEPAEKQIEHVPGVSEKTIEHHEDAAGWALAMTGLAGVIALISLVTLARSREAGMPRALAVMALLACAVAMASLARTGNLGGHIRHPEIDASAGIGQSPAAGEEHDEH